MLPFNNFAIKKSNENFINLNIINAPTKVLEHDLKFFKFCGYYFLYEAYLTFINECDSNKYFKTQTDLDNFSSNLRNLI